MPQYKAKEKTALMYTYPVLMAHDLVGYDKVIVGDDQRPHIEFARDILPRVGEICPEPTYTSFKIMDLRHPQNKMSKSDPKSCLFLDDNDCRRNRNSSTRTLFMAQTSCDYKSFGLVYRSNHRHTRLCRHAKTKNVLRKGAT